MTAAILPSPSFVGPIPDLLSTEASVRIDLASLRQTLVFAFAMGGSIEAHRNPERGSTFVLTLPAP